MKTTLIKIVNVAVLLATLFVFRSTIQAQIIKSDTTTMDMAADWSGNLPSDSTIGQFDGTISAVHEADLTLGAYITLEGLVFTDSDGNGAINGPVTVLSDGNTLTLDNSGINMTATAIHNVTLNCGLTLTNGEQQWQANSGQTLTIGGTFTHAGCIVDFSSLAGTLGGLANVNGILGPWATTGTGTAKQYATVSGGTVSAYAGYTTAATAANITDTTGTVNYDAAAGGTLGAGASFNTLRYTGATATFTGSFTANGIMNAQTGGSDILEFGPVNSTANITIGSTKELVIDTAGSDAGNTMYEFFDNFVGGSSGSPNTITVNFSGSSPIVDLGGWSPGAQFGNFYGTIQVVNSSSGDLKFRNANGVNVNLGMSNAVLNLGTGSAIVLYKASSSGSSSGSVTNTFGAIMGGVNTALQNGDASGGSAFTYTYDVGFLNTSTEFDGEIKQSSGDGTIAVMKDGTGTWTITHANTYSGGTTLNNGTVNFASASLGTGRITFNGGTLQWATGNTADISAHSASPANTITVNSPSGTMDVNGNNVTLAEATSTEVIGGAGTLNVMSTAANGSLTLSGVNPLTGNTVISSGTLLLSGSGSIATSPSIIVSNGATFDVSGTSSTFTLGGSQGLFSAGTINGSVNTTSGSVIQADAGVSYSTNTFNNNLTMVSGANCNMSIGTKYNQSNDLFVVDGTVTLNNTAFNIKAPSTSVSLDTTADYVLMTAGSISGTVASTPVWNVAPLNAANYSVLIIGNNVVLHHTASTPPSATGSATPSTLVRGQNTLLTVTVTPGTDPTIGSVAVNASSIGGSSSVSLSEVGSSYVYTNTITIPNGASDGLQSLPVTVTDTTSLQGTTTIALTIVPSTQVWGGGSMSDANWSDGLNWLSGNPPQNGDNVVFAGSTQLTPNMDNSYAVNALTFTNTAGSFIIGTANGSTLTLVGGVTNDSANGETLNVPVTLNTTQPFNTAAGSLTLAGVVSGSGGVAQSGPAALIFSGVNTYTGNTTIGTGGLMQISDPGQLNNGAYAGNIVNGGGFTYDSTAAQTLTGIISGGGTLTLDQGSLVLDGTDTYTGGTTVNGGTLEFEGAASVPASGTLTLNNTGTVDLTTATILQNVVVNGTYTITGNGNSGTGIATLNDTGTLTLGVNGGSGVFDMTGPITGTGSITLGSPITLRLNGTTGDNTAILNLGTGSATTAVRSGVTLAIAFGGLQGGSGTQLTGVETAAGDLNMTYTIGGAGTDTEFDGVIANGSSGGTVSLTMVGTNTLLLTGANTYTGVTTISNGTLMIEGSLANTAVNIAGGTLGGNGTVNGEVTNQVGGTLYPGLGNGDTSALTMSGDLALAGNTVFTLSSSANSEITGIGTLTVGGTLTVTNTGPALSVGNTFNLFSATTYAPASFSSIVGSPGAGLTYSYNNGVLSVVAGPSGPATITNSVSGNTLSLSWPAGQGWMLQFQTNSLSTGLGTNWVNVPSSTGISSTNITLNPGMPVVFYRLFYP